VRHTECTHPAFQPKTILATMTGWCTGQAIRILPPHAVADQVEAGFLLPVAGHAKVLQGMRK
jgi:hypothetical protein